jgi:hypothetical protein
LTTIKYPDGEVTKYYHGGHLLRRREVLNGRFDAGGTLIPGSDEPNGPPSWWTTYAYDSQYRLTESIETTEVKLNMGRIMRLSYDDQLHNWLSRGNVNELRLLPDATDAYQDDNTRSWTYEYDPITNKPLRAIGPMGEEEKWVFDHQERDYQSLIDDPRIGPWGVLPAVPPNPTQWGLGDINGDGGVGVAFEPIIHSTPPVPVANVNGPGTSATQVLQTVNRYNSTGQPTEVVEPSGRTTRKYYQHGLEWKIEIDPSGLALATTWVRDDY